MKNRILPCPFCGAEAEIKEHEVGDFFVPYYGVRCSKNERHSLELCCKTAIEAIEMWNERPVAQQWHDASEPPADGRRVMFCYEGYYDHMRPWSNWLAEKMLGWRDLPAKPERDELCVQ